MKKQKEPLQLKEDTLEVGLDRHRRRDRDRSSWFSERAPVIFIVLFFVGVVGPFWLMRGWFDSAPPQSGPRPRLVAGEPTLVWAEGSASQLRSVRVSVVNTGSVNATGVKVWALLRGKRFSLSGPDVIDAGDGEVFSGVVDAVFRSGENAEIAATCANCQ
jgi:hypothetical protein